MSKIRFQLLDTHSDDCVSFESYEQLFAYVLRMLLQA